MATKLGNLFENITINYEFIHFYNLMTTTRNLFLCCINIHSKFFEQIIKCVQLSTTLYRFLCFDEGIHAFQPCELQEIRTIEYDVGRHHVVVTQGGELFLDELARLCRLDRPRTLLLSSFLFISYFGGLPLWMRFMISWMSSSVRSSSPKQESLASVK